MRRVTLLALLLLPSVAMAGSFNFKNTGQTGGLCTQMVGNTTCRTGDFVSGTISSLLSAPIDITVVGTLNTIDIQIRNLSCSSMTMCTFTQMGADVSHNGVVIFDLGGLVSGELVRTATTATINVDWGGIDTVFFHGSFTGNTLTSGNAFVTFPPIQQIPEPGALELLELGLLGTGVIGLARTASCKLKR